MIEGPLGIWPWPILNTIITIAGANEESDVEITEVVRDDNGRIQSIEVIRKDG